MVGLLQHMQPFFSLTHIPLYLLSLCRCGQVTCRTWCTREVRLGSHEPQSPSRLTTQTAARVLLDTRPTKRSLSPDRSLGFLLLLFLLLLLFHLTSLPPLPSHFSSSSSSISQTSIPITSPTMTPLPLRSTNDLCRLNLSKATSLCVSCCLIT